MKTIETKCSCCKTGKIVELMEVSHKDEAIYQTDKLFPIQIIHTVIHKYICFSCGTEITRPEIRNYYF